MISGAQFNLPQSSATVGRQLGNQMQASQTGLNPPGSNSTLTGINGPSSSVGGVSQSASRGTSGSAAFRNPSA